MLAGFAGFHEWCRPDVVRVASARPGRPDVACYSAAPMPLFTGAPAPAVLRGWARVTGSCKDRGLSTFAPARSGWRSARLDWSGQGTGAVDNRANTVENGRPKLR